MWNLKRNDPNELIYETEIDSQTKRMNLRLLGERASLGVWDGHVHTAIFQMDKQKGWQMELCSM